MGKIRRFIGIELKKDYFDIDKERTMKIYMEE